ncbi:type VII secretion AAA-ATPase EccA [Gordonia neofelifaecis]|uniref:AAA ATPase central domain-containing protein n=1 Tax=Gordonia neofelifaecis NRRL B-59395 TaxID=644548 RepID=F1YMZ6_9ACTN|nr:type VII secretion AAA-ATPase EccA [Gordonia neofelifaecis]EGD53883.1 AAA ATPase central domain-containing protein [Gordonia neofelifaecis NRRL B-59395]
MIEGNILSRRAPGEARQRAREYFVAGLTAAGLLTGGPPPDPHRARAAFARATEFDPTLGDAWLGRVSAGDRSGPVLLGLYRARESIGAEQRRLGMPAGALVGHLASGMFIDLPITTSTDVAAGYAASLLAGGDVDGAEQVLNESGDCGPTAAFCRGILEVRRRRWRAVLSTLAPSSDWTDEYLCAAADFMLGTACVQLGMFDEGLRRLGNAEASVLTTCRPHALFTIGLAHRARGDEPSARACLEEAYALDSGLTDAARALADPTLQLTIERVDETAPATAVVPQSGVDESALRAVADELGAQIGLGPVKDQVERLRAAVTLAQLRAEKGLRTQSRSLHLAFTGPPGTGKTTIARLVARLYRALGLLATDTVVEVSRRDLVGQHLGSTAPKTSAVIDSALDGVLFIDEAYTLIQEGLAGGDAFGREAVDTLLARMENDRDRLVVIVAGYDDEIDRLMASNEGLASRFARRIKFTSYTPGELIRIAESIAGRRDARLSADAAAELEQLFADLYDDVSGGRRASDVAGNGRFVRNIVEAAEEERELRLARTSDLDTLTDADLMTITGDDVRAARAASI